MSAGYGVPVAFVVRRKKSCSRSFPPFHSAMAFKATAGQIRKTRVKTERISPERLVTKARPRSPIFVADDVDMVGDFSTPPAAQAPIAFTPTNGSWQHLPLPDPSPAQAESPPPSEVSEVQGMASAATATEGGAMPGSPAGPLGASKADEVD